MQEGPGLRYKSIHNVKSETLFDTKLQDDNYLHGISQILRNFLVKLQLF